VEVLYGILIAALMGASAFGGFVLCLKVKKPEVRYRSQPLGDTKEIEEIQERAFKEPFNLEDMPKTASGFANRFNQTASEELKRATRA